MTKYYPKQAFRPLQKAPAGQYRAGAFAIYAKILDAAYLLATGAPGTGFVAGKAVCFMRQHFQYNKQHQNIVDETQEKGLI